MGAAGSRSRKERGMTEEVPAQSAGDESATPRPRPRRRRRGGRGRGRSQSSSQERSQASAEAEGGPSGEEPSEKAGEQKSPQQQRSRGRSRSSTGRAQTKSTEDPSAEAPCPARAAGAEPQAADRASGSTSRSRSRRRRRSGSRSGGTGVAQGARDGSPTEAASATDGDVKEAGRDERPAEGDGGATGATTTPAARRRRRRRRRKPSGEGNGRASATEGAGTPAAAAVAGVPTPVKEAGDDGAARAAPPRTSRAGRRGGPLRRRRRPDVQVERRTEKTMLMAERDGRVEIVVLEARDLVEHFVARSGAQSMVGNVYLGKVQSVLPGMEAAFVDVGRGRNAVLYAGEVSYDEDVEEGQRRIERVLKPGQSLVVQVTKDPMKGKGARLTAQISLPGRYLVYVPDGGASGISKRLPDGERERLRKIMKRIRPSEAGVIVRTAAEAATEEELAADLDRLKKAWESIRRKSRRGGGPPGPFEG